MVGECENEQKANVDNGDINSLLFLYFVALIDHDKCN